MGIKTLKNYFRLSNIVITFSLFLIFYLFSSYVHTNLTVKENQKISESLSKQVFNSMYQVMRKGWSREELQDFIHNTKSSFQTSSYDVEIYRSKNVEKLFGKIEQGEITPDIQNVFQTKQKLSTSDNNTYQNNHPHNGKK